jgi:putative ABC transport system ATP-binding protein
MDKEIARLVDHLNLTPYIDKTVDKLSVGQQQRVAVARALIGSPEIVIADEPTSSLDDDVTDKFIQLLLKECEQKNTTVIFVSHDKRLAKHFDREIVLKDINNVEGESHD